MKTENLENLTTEESKKLNYLVLTKTSKFTKKNFDKSNNFTTNFYQNLELNEIKIVNTLLYIFNQYHNYLSKDKTNLGNFLKFFKEEENLFIIPFQDFLKLLKYDTNNNLTIKELENHLENIRKGGLRYVKYNPNTKREERIGTSFITKYKIITNRDLFEQMIEQETRILIKIDKELYTDIFEMNKIGFTTVDIDMNKLQSKMGIGLYEELKRISNLKQIEYRPIGGGKFDRILKNEYKKNFEYTLKEINEICNTDFKQLSHIKQKILIQYKKLVKNNFLHDVYSFETKNKKLKINIDRYNFDKSEYFLKNKESGLNFDELSRKFEEEYLSKDKDKEVKQKEVVKKEELKKVWTI